MKTRIALAGAIIAGGLVTGGSISSRIQGWWYHETQCTVLARNHDVQMSFVGWGARTMCAETLRSSSDLMEFTDGAIAVEPIVCQYTIKGVRVTVRDTGLQLIGSAVCRQISTQVED